MVAARYQYVIEERHVGIVECQQWRTVEVVCRDQGRQPGRVLRVEESGRSWQRACELHIHDYLARIIDSRGEPGTGVIRQRYEQHIHALDLGALVVGDTRSEFEQHRVVRGTGLLHEFCDHCYCAFVMRDHQAQEQFVEGRAFGGRKLCHLLGGRHAGHLVRRVHGVVRGRFGYVLATIAQPSLHELDFILLRDVNAAGDIQQLLAVRAIGCERRHFQGLVMVRNHVLHEPGIIGRVAGIGDLDRLVGAEFARRFARRARVNDGRLLGLGRH